MTTQRFKARKATAKSVPIPDPIFAAIDAHKASVKLIDAERDGVAWDYRTGIAPLREQYERARRAEDRAAMRLAQVKPTTPAGAGAMVDHVRRDIKDDLNRNWQKIALKTAADALKQECGR